ncbi:MAG: hypothetical protein AAF488_05905 [Planctomycetota bacterium]
MLISLQLFGGVLLATLVGAASPVLDDGRVAASESAPIGRTQAFAGFGRVGLVGRGTVNRTFEVSTVTSEGAWRSVEFVDRWLEASGDLRLGSRREMVHTRDGSKRSVRWQLAQRVVKVEIDGTSVHHESQGPLGPRSSKRIPTQMEQPWVLDSSRVTDYQRLFDRLLAEKGGGVDALDGVTVVAIDPAKLAAFDFRIRVHGAEPVLLPDGERRFAKVEVTRVEPTRGSLPAAGSLDEHKLFWLAGDGEIVRMEVPNQPRYQGEHVVRNLKYWPDARGAITRFVEVGGVGFSISHRDVSTITEPDATAEPGPAILVVHDGAATSRSILPSTVWELTRSGVTVGVLQIDPASEVSLGRAGDAMTALRADPTVDPKQLHLATIGAALPAPRSWDLSPFAGWLIINGQGKPAAAVEETVKRSELPIRLVWGDDGPEFHARRAFAEGVRRGAESRVLVSPLSSTDDRMRYVTGVPVSAERDELGVTRGYALTLIRWFTTPSRPKAPRAPLDAPKKSADEEDGRR